MDTISIDLGAGTQAGEINCVGCSCTDIGPGRAADIIRIDQGIECATGIKTIEVIILYNILSETVSLICYGGAANVSYTIISSLDGVRGKHVTITVCGTGGGGRGSAEAYHYTRIVS